MLKKLLCQTSTLCKAGSILKGLWSLLHNSLKKRWFQSLHKTDPISPNHASSEFACKIQQKADYITRHLTSLPAPCKITPGCKHSIRWVKVRGHLLLKLVIRELGLIITLSLHLDGSMTLSITCWQSKPSGLDHLVQSKRSTDSTANKKACKESPSILPLKGSGRSNLTPWGKKGYYGAFTINWAS